MTGGNEMALHHNTLKIYLWVGGQLAITCDIILQTNLVPAGYFLKYY